MSTYHQRYLELDDQFEQERRAMRAREKEREKRERELEKKAREQADQCESLWIKPFTLLPSLCLSRLLKHWHDVYKCTFKIYSYHLFFVVMALEDQKANLTRELTSIKHTHNKVCHLSSQVICFSLALACWLL